MSFTFENPGWLAAIPIAWLALWLRSRSRRRPALMFSSLAGLRDLPRTRAQRLRRLLPLLQAAGLALLIAAAARPGVVRTWINAYTEGVAIQIVIDRSESMRNIDLDEDPFDRHRVNRLDVVKDVVRDFIDTAADSGTGEKAAKNLLPGRPDDLIGLVSFAGYPQALCPATLDHEALLQTLATLRVQREDRYDPEAHLTAIGDALATAVDRLDDIEARSKVIILLSDGENNVGNVAPLAAADIAAERRIKTYTIGVGTPGQGLDEKTLAAIAERTGGLYFNARGRADLVRIYSEIDKLEKSRAPAFKQSHLLDRYQLPALLGAGLILMHMLLGATRFRSLP